MFQLMLEYAAVFIEQLNIWYSLLAFSFCYEISEVSH